MDRREVGSKKAEKAKGADKAKDGAKEEVAVSTTWIFGGESEAGGGDWSDWNNPSYNRAFGDSVV